MNEIQNKLWNIELLVEEIKKFPQTYQTILKSEYNNGTFQTILRKKINNLQKLGVICKTSIPGTRFGQIILYTIPKKYHILIEGTRLGSVVYCFFTFQKKGRKTIELIDYWILKNSIWQQEYAKKEISEGDVLKWI